MSLDALRFHFISSVTCDCVIIFNFQIIIYSQNTHLYIISVKIPELELKGANITATIVFSF